MGTEPLSHPMRVLTDYSRKRVGTNEVMRALAGHTGWLAPALMFARAEGQDFFLDGGMVLFGTETRLPPFLAGFGGLAAFLFFYVRALRRSLVRFLSADGVTTRGGKKYRWENLRHLDYVTVRYKGSRNNFLLRAVSNFIFAGVENLKIEMVFTDGTATLAPLIENQREVLDLMDAIPVRRKSDGKISSPDTDAACLRNDSIY